MAQRFPWRVRLAREAIVTYLLQVASAICGSWIAGAATEGYKCEANTWFLLFFQGLFQISCNTFNLLYYCGQGLYNITIKITVSLYQYRIPSPNWRYDSASWECSAIVNIYIHTMPYSNSALPCVFRTWKRFSFNVPKTPSMSTCFSNVKFDASSRRFYQIEGMKWKETNCAGVTSSIPFPFPLKCFVTF